MGKIMTSPSVTLGRASVSVSQSEHSCSLRQRTAEGASSPVDDTYQCKGTFSFQEMAYHQASGKWYPVFVGDFSEPMESKSVRANSHAAKIPGYRSISIHRGSNDTYYTKFVGGFDHVPSNEEKDVPHT